MTRTYISSKAFNALDYNKMDQGQGKNLLIDTIWSLGLEIQSFRTLGVFGREQTLNTRTVAERSCRSPQANAHLADGVAPCAVDAVGMAVTELLEFAKRLMGECDHLSFCVQSRG